MQKSIPETESKDTIRFVCISDTHCQTNNLTLPDGDVLIHAGDFTHTGTPEEVQEFDEFLNKQSHPYKIVIAGNHDTTFDTANYPVLREIHHKYCKEIYNPKKVKEMLTNCIYLEDSAVEIYGYKIYGTPWVKEHYYRWGFSLKRERDLIPKWKAIPDDTDILITHGPPYGNKDLADEVLNRVNPLVHIFGHIHEGYGEMEKDGIKFVNASFVNNTGFGTNKPIVFELPNRENLITRKKKKSGS